MVDYKYKDLFTKSHINKQIKISTDDGKFTATNEDIHWEDFELIESLCSDSELWFGSCEASMVKFQIRNAFIPLAGKWITITEILDGNTDEPFQYGRYKVFSDVPTADREYRDIVAYDAMYDILNADVAAWYHLILPNKESTVTMKQFRESFIRQFGLTEVLPQIGTKESETYGLVNDSMTVERTINPEQISGKDVITAICEINGCFGHIGRDGKFHYIYLLQNIQGLYPANDLYPDHAPTYLPQQQETGHLYPQDPKSTRIGSGTYIKCQYEDYVVRNISKLQIRREENDIGCIYGEGDNCYVIEDNFLVYGKSSSQLNEIAENVFKKIADIVYRPFSAECVGNPCFEVGEPLRFITKYEIVETYILSRTLKGIQGIRDRYSAEGTEKREEVVNSVQKSIIQLKGKTNTLTRNVDETKSELKDTEKNLRSTITQTAEQIRLEVEDGDKKLSSEIKQTASEIRAEVKDTDERLSSEIKQNADSITAEVKRAKDSEASLGIRADSIVMSVSDLRENTESEFRQVANRLSLKVESGEVQSMIDVSLGKVVLSANQIDLNGYVSINGNFNITQNGDLEFTGWGGNTVYFSGSELIGCGAIVSEYYNLRLQGDYGVDISTGGHKATVDGYEILTEGSDFVQSAKSALNYSYPGKIISVDALRDAVIALEDRVSALEGKVSAL